MRTVKKPMAPVKPCSAAAGEPNDSVLYTLTAVRDSPVASIFTSCTTSERAYHTFITESGGGALVQQSSHQKELSLFSVLYDCWLKGHTYTRLCRGTLVQELRQQQKQQQHYQQRPIAQLSLLKCFSEAATNILLLYISNSTLLHQQLFFFFLLFNIFKL